MTLPTLTCLLDDGTGTFPYDISSKVLFTDGFSFSRGRADWQGAVTAGQLTLTLNNSDGRFTAGSTIINATSPIRVDQRLRIKETVNGVTLTRFTGYVKSWPVAWPATVGTFATTQILVTDAQARAERHVMGVQLAEEIQATSPSGYWPLSEPASATTASDISGNTAGSLAQVDVGTAVAFGSSSAPGSSDSTAATFAGGKFLTAVVASVGATPGLAAAFSTTSAVASDVWICQVSTPTGARYAGFTINAGVLTAQASAPAVIPGTFNDGTAHVLGVRFTSSTTYDAYVDGVVVATGLGALNLTGSDIQRTVAFGGNGRAAGGFAFTGLIAHAAVWATAPTAAQMASITGYAVSELTSARAARLALYAGIAAGAVDTGLTTVPIQSTFGGSTWDALQAVVDAELGAAFIDENGALEFHNRNRNPAKTSPDLTISATSYITPDVQPVLDDQQIINYFEETATGTGVLQVARNTTSELGDGTATNPGHGRYSQSAEYLVSTDAEALDRANWIIANFADPTTRYGTLTINLYAMPAALAQTVVAAVDIDCWLRVTNLGSQNPDGTTADVVVEGFTENCSESAWTLVCNVVSRSLFQAWILGDTTYSVLGSTTRLYI